MYIINIHHHKNVIICRMTSPKMSEDERRNFIMSDISINEALDKDCSPMKETYACPNDCYCKDLFPRSTAKSILRYSIMPYCYLLLKLINFMMFYWIKGTSAKKFGMIKPMTENPTLLFERITLCLCLSNFLSRPMVIFFMK